MKRAPRGDVLPVGKLPTPLLARLLSTHGTTDPAVLVGPGIGRDAAAIALGDVVLVAKTDPITFATQGAATYLVDVNANDLACLGATPRWLLATALLPEGITTGEVEQHFAELTEACRRRGISLVGGHTEVTSGLDRTILVGLLLGETTREHLLRPGGARAGDHLLLTKAIALEGTALLAREIADHQRSLIGDAVVARAAALLRDPGISVVHEARLLLDTGGVTALHDPTEGGLAMAVRELAMASGLGAEIDLAAVPIRPETAVFAAALGLDPLGMLASGSLLVAAAPAATAGLLAAGRAAGIDIVKIGHLVEAAAGFTLRADGQHRELPLYETDEISRALSATGNSA